MNAAPHDPPLPRERAPPPLLHSLGLRPPLDAPDPANANPLSSDAFSAPRETHPVWSPDRPRSPAAARPPELNPPADPPIDIQIDLPADIEPPQPKPAIQARLRNWWSPTTR